ncbi:ADP-ribosyltransferase [Vibrio tubiashii]|uniref:ADP-ribosyltransferase domain-containing protein n=1 Tax=Vibrio tubiashii TaxID=29498 RepID=UPI001EFD88E0|nr:ADP-ribosyltransferase domain-containing protein [Vibrio tubiashii]MCG9579426.1 ADP-ribosyltransferase [Vibrio tubiashii]MCG9582218.1 ADP-ribosyltransferase [Vibrio tubiashii]MCG9615809.1 ADP-ribosyltransferase [Vibrio tubiashii]MCG9686046.1 ADP-ribosyltransferase [Vibrio tubiashii]
MVYTYNNVTQHTLGVSVQPVQVQASTAANQLSQVQSVPVNLTGQNLPPLPKGNHEPVALKQVEAEFNKAVMRVAEYEGSVVDSILTKVKQQFPQEAPAMQMHIASTAADKVKAANHSFEMNHLGNKLLTMPAVEYMSQSYLRRVLENAEKLENAGVKLHLGDEGGAGFLAGWNTSDDQLWGEQMNKLVNGKVNARVLTTAGYMFQENFRLHFDKIADSINTPLWNEKNSPENARVDIFNGSSLKKGPPVTVQPHGTAWLKYATWNLTENMGHERHQQIVASRNHDTYDTSELYKHVEPALYRDESSGLTEREKATPGFSVWEVRDSEVKTVGQDNEVSVNWKKQNLDKGLPMFSGPSSTTSYMYEVVRLLDIPDNEVQSFRAMLLGWMIQGRDHSFTEIMGAFDAYAQEREEGGVATTRGDAKLAWEMRKTKQWETAYENLFTEDINLPAQEAKTVRVKGQEIRLPAIPAVHMTKAEFDRKITGGDGYPSQYASSDNLKVIRDDLSNKGFSTVRSGLAAEKVMYGAYNPVTNALFDSSSEARPVSIPEHAGTDMSAAFFDADKDKAMNDWLSQQSPDEYEKLLDDAASLFAESSQEQSLGHIYTRENSPNNYVLEAFLLDKRTNMLLHSDALNLDNSGESNVSALVKLAGKEATQEARQQAVLGAVGDNRTAQDALIKGMLLAVQRFWTGEPTEAFNPGYSSQYGSPKDDIEFNLRFEGAMRNLKGGPSVDKLDDVREEAIKLRNMLRAAIHSPLFEGTTEPVYRGVSQYVGQELLALKPGEEYKFPGFMSTSREPGVGLDYANGAFVVINPPKTGSLGADIVGISKAPAEKEVLVADDTVLQLDKTFTLNITKEIPSTATGIRRRQYEMGLRQAPIKINVMTPDGQASPEGEVLLKDVIADIKAKPKANYFGEPIKVAVLNVKS